MTGASTSAEGIGGGASAGPDGRRGGAQVRHDQRQDSQHHEQACRHPAQRLHVDPMRERRAYYETQTGYVDELIYNGTLRAREEGKHTLSAAKKAMGLAGAWNRISRAAEKRIKKQEVL